MSGGGGGGQQLPPLPALIPISALRKSPPSLSEDDVDRENSGVMGEQRPRRSRRQPPSDNDDDDDLIDNPRSRGTSAALQPRKIRSERHRKSDRRRRRAKTQLETSEKRHRDATVTNDRQRESIISHRVNPIFVWVRQEDSRIVEVKCEDYDKRNRILLTKTPQGWRATPRTETLVPSQKEEEVDRKQHHHHHHHRSKKSKKHKARKSAAVQVDDLLLTDENQEEENEETGATNTTAYPSWESPVNVESLLPSHTIHVPKKNSSSVADDSVNSAQNEQQTSAADISPLDNLLAVAELEFNQQIQSGEWDKRESIIEDMEQLQDLIECCTQNENTENSQKEECDYTEDDDNNLAMDDILNKLEQSLRTPEPATTEKPEPEPEPEEDAEAEEEVEEEDEEEKERKIEECTRSEEPTDLSIKTNMKLTIEIPPPPKSEEFEQPTDLSIPRVSKPSPRPPSQSSEALQSPQPSGIPAVPPSPDIVSPNSVKSGVKSTFLESLLASTSPKIALNSEVTIERQKEPLDLGKCRKSASPTVTCSEEVKKKALEEEPPPPKKQKPSPESLTLKNLLSDTRESKKNEEKDTPKLLELLNINTELNPVKQLHEVLADNKLNVPDPMLVPKDKLSKIIANPSKEIPELLRSRPELRLPEALSYPHLLQDPDILVITLEQLETIVKKQNPHTPSKACPEKQPPKPKISNEENVKTHQSKECEKKSVPYDYNEMAALNQMLWLPYISQMEPPFQFNTNPELVKLLSNFNMPTAFPNQIPDLSHLMSANRFPSLPIFPPPNLSHNNPLEMQMWREAIITSSMTTNHNNNNNNNNRNPNNVMEKLNFNMNKSFNQQQNQPKYPMQNKQFFQPGFPLPYNMNLPQNHKPMTAPQFNAPPYQKNIANTSRHHNSQIGKSNIKNNTEPQHHQGLIRTKPAYKLMNNVPSQHHHNHHHHHHHPPREKSGQPMDLSGATTTTTTPGRIKVKQQQQLMDPMNQRKLMRHDDIPEVGSTTASIEEMQEAHKHLWHPLFGNDKCYNNPWNWPPSTVATAE